MDPAAVGQSSPGLLAAFIAISLALVKILELSIVALIKKVKPPKDAHVQVSLEPETLHKFTDVHTMVTDIHGLVKKTDNDGTPMIYSSRSGMEAVRDIAVIIRNVNQTQERIMSLIERLEQKFSDHDRADAIVQGEIAAALQRVGNQVEANGRRLDHISK
jgi:hypothetical protein